MNILPPQKLSTKEKTKKDSVTKKTVMEATIDFYIDEGSWENQQEELLSLNRLLEDELDEKDYEYVLNPFNTTIDKYKRFGSRLRNFNIIKPVVDLYMGEFGKRFNVIQVIDTNPNEDNEYKKGLNTHIEKYYTNKVIRDLNNLGIQTGQNPPEQTFNQAIEEYNRSFDENRVISGQEILDYIIFDQNLKDKYQNVLKDWLVHGRAITYKGVFNDDIDFEHVPSWELSFPKHLPTEFLEDAQYVVRRIIMTPNEILDRWHGKLDEETVKWLDEKGRDNNTNTNRSNNFIILPTQYINNKEDYNKYSVRKIFNGIEVYHVQYRSFRKVGILTTEDELGQIIEVQVDDTYKVNKEAGDISIVWDWESVIEEGWRIDKDKYIDVGVLPYNRMELNNSSEQKLCYNGRVNQTSTGGIQSIVKAGRPYQIIYNILHYQFEKIINKNKDKITVIPLGLVPKGRYGWDEEKFMYQAHATSLAFIDETSPNAAAALQGIKVLDMSLGNFAKEMIELMQGVKAEWWESIGMNRQRYGDTKASDGKGVTEQAIYRSAVISEELFRKFEKFQEKDYEGLLDLSKLAFIDGKKSKYINSEGREAFLNINPDEAITHTENSYGIFVRNSTTENEKLEFGRQFAATMIQNGESDAALELIDSTNFTKTKELVKRINAINAKREEAQAQADRDNLKEIEESRAATAREEMDVRIYEADKKYDAVVDSQYIKLQGENGNSSNTDQDGKDDYVETSEAIRMNTHKINKENKELSIKERDLKRKNRETSAKIKAPINRN